MYLCRPSCPDRIVGCHANCEYYQENKKKFNEQKEKQRKAEDPLYAEYRKDLFVKNYHNPPKSPRKKTKH